MIDIQEATKVIQDMLPVMEPEEDYMTIVAAEERISASEAARKRELEEAHANLKALSRVLETAKISSTRPASVPSEEAHAETLDDLDATKLSLAKAISDSETLLANRESELARLKEENRRLEVYDPANEHEQGLDGSSLRLALYKGLGFTPIVNKDGDIAKMLIRSKPGEVYNVDFTSGQSDFEYTKLLWKLSRS